MLKRDLRDGMVVICRNGFRGVLINGCAMDIARSITADIFDENLMSKGEDGFDIIAVGSTSGKCFNELLDDQNIKILWKRGGSSDAKDSDEKIGDISKVLAKIISTLIDMSSGNHDDVRIEFNITEQES